MQRSNANKKFNVIFPTVLLMLGLAMIILSVFDIFAPDDNRWIFTILGILFVVDSVFRFFYIKKHKRNEKYIS